MREMVSWLTDLSPTILHACRLVPVDMQCAVRCAAAALMAEPTACARLLTLSFSPPPSRPPVCLPACLKIRMSKSAPLASCSA